MESKHIVSFKSPLGGSIDITKHTFSPLDSRPAIRISFVAGLHGDELEGVYIGSRLIGYLRTLQETQPNAFRGEVNVYPAVNPSAINSGTRHWPNFSSDMNRTLGKNKSNNIPDQASSVLIKDLLSGSDLVVDIHSSNLHLREIPQIRIIKDFADKLTPLAELCGVNLIWVHPMADLFESTLGYNLNKQKLPTLVVESGICLRINQKNCDQILAGFINLLQKTGTLDLDDKSEPIIETSKIAQPGQVFQIHSRNSGIFVGHGRLGCLVEKSEPLGQIMNPIKGEVLEDVVTPEKGLLFTIRDQPLVYEGSLLARVAIDEGSL
ncbi:MAG: M14 family metallopeptidase [Nitrospinales bacterium]